MGTHPAPLTPREKRVLAGKKREVAKSWWGVAKSVKLRRDPVILKAWKSYLDARAEHVGIHKDLAIQKLHVLESHVSNSKIDREIMRQRKTRDAMIKDLASCLRNSAKAEKLLKKKGESED